MDSCDSTGNKKDLFNVNESLYIQGVSFPNSADLPIYIVPDQTRWVDGATIPTRILGPTSTIQTESDGSIKITKLWEFPSEGRFDIIVDVNKDGVYNEGIDALDDYDMNSSAGASDGTSVIPEFSTAFAIISFFALTLLCLKLKNRYH